MFRDQDFGLKEGNFVRCFPLFQLGGFVFATLASRDRERFLRAPRLFFDSDGRKRPRLTRLQRHLRETVPRPAPRI